MTLTTLPQRLLERLDRRSRSRVVLRATVGPKDPPSVATRPEDRRGRPAVVRASVVRASVVRQPVLRVLRSGPAPLGRAARRLALHRALAHRVLTHRHAGKPAGARVVARFSAGRALGARSLLTRGPRAVAVPRPVAARVRLAALPSGRPLRGTRRAPAGGGARLGPAGRGAAPRQGRSGAPRAARSSSRASAGSDGSGPEGSARRLRSALGQARSPAALGLGERAAAPAQTRVAGVSPPAPRAPGALFGVVAPQPGARPALICHPPVPPEA